MYFGALVGEYDFIWYIARTWNTLKFADFKVLRVVDAQTSLNANTLTSVLVNSKYSTEYYEFYCDVIRAVRFFINEVQYR
jgi:hypothetical protein